MLHLHIQNFTSKTNLRERFIFDTDKTDSDPAVL